MGAPADRFTAAYYARRYRGRPWRERGDRPILMSTLLRGLRPCAGGDLLDVGCGEGHLLRRASKAFRVRGCDVSADAIALARVVAPVAELAVASADALPFADASFDVLTALDVVEHLPNPGLFLDEARRVLRADGLLVFSTPNPDSLGHRLKGARSHVESDETHISVKSLRSWRETVSDRGFEVQFIGTDTLWDVPYFRFAPARAQRLLFIAAAQLLWLVRVAYPWKYGENIWCFAVRR